ncbi:hypothetical protein [Brevibacillus borstelensis]|uniref:hypothetical protein n=1 Tax=Brevibacillus borstelensis TaxID=45462 RepID=UPI0030C47F77
MLDFGAVGFEWGALIIGLITTLVFIGVPVGLIIFFAVRSGLRRKIKELEQRIERLERERS